MRKDQKYGANDLLAFSWICMSIGGVVGGAAYAILGILNMYDAYYGFPCLASICLLVTTLFIGKDIDGDAKLILDMDFTTRVRYNLK